jgi:hypothetical protein
VSETYRIGAVEGVGVRVADLKLKAALLRNEPRWLPLDEIINTNRETVALTGEVHFLRDPGLLGSAWARPMQLWHYSLPDKPDMPTLAASLLLGIAGQHALKLGEQAHGLVDQLLGAHAFDAWLHFGGHGDVPFFDKCRGRADLTQQDYARLSAAHPARGTSPSRPWSNGLDARTISCVGAGTRPGRASTTEKEPLAVVLGMPAKVGRRVECRTSFSQVMEMTLSL